ncbi:hypothetical protein PRIPAC_83170 [Pristionchus pacificus]|uniref:Phospholipid scramblase n=1 Tax=Pristionchus pacificus TaxID=54126 RepID=A0A2A6BUF8_PRIPA|nr:hypothetical protein PRIPAC_83170 [Pristionchus pacificus]|eukprot:PDM69550.1 hypothetical protein PRIPAC_44646 [Pristionchus pacificus]
MTALTGRIRRPNAFAYAKSKQKEVCLRVCFPVFHALLQTLFLLSLLPTGRLASSLLPRPSAIYRTLAYRTPLDMINQQPYPPPYPQVNNYPPPGPPQGANYPPPQGANYPPPPYSPGPNYPPPAPITQQPGTPGFGNNIDVCKTLIDHFEEEIRYKILNGAGQQIYAANEESDCIERFFCHHKRGFVIHEIILIKKNFHICTALNAPLHMIQIYCHICSFCQQQATIESPPGNIVATVRQTWRPTHTVRGPDGQIIFTLNAPSLKMVCCCREQIYEVYAGKDKVVGISKFWGGALKEFFTTADIWGITFPPQMPVHHRAIVLGSLFFIDFVSFEGQGCTVQGWLPKLAKCGIF